MTRAPVVLLVDNHRDSLAMYAIGLLAIGFEVVTAESADDAFVRARACHPDLIVADLWPLGISEQDFVRQLRNDARTKDARLIALTGDSTAGPRARAGGFDRFLLKPCEPDALAREVHDVLRQRRVAGATPPGAVGNRIPGGESQVRASSRVYQEALDRIRADFEEMPGMRLTAEQVRRLCGVDGTVCARVLDELVRTRVLRVGPEGHYVRATEAAAKDSPLSRRAVG
jgi:CheY-like chemotaxis protein